MARSAVRVRAEVITALAILGLSCGKATIKRRTTYQATVDANADGVVTLHRGDCTAYRLEVRVEPGAKDAAACYARLTPGQQVEVSDVVYAHTLADCGREQPGSSVGGCSIDHVTKSWTGTPCPDPAAP